MAESVVLSRGGLVQKHPDHSIPKKLEDRIMWQGDTFQFRIADVRKVYVTGFTDDRSRFRVKFGVYLHKSARESVDALSHVVRKGRIPREMYLDNGKQFIAKEFKA